MKPKFLLTLTHEYPPDQVWGVGKLVSSTQDLIGSSWVNRVACLSLSTFRNYRRSETRPGVVAPPATSGTPGQLVDLLAQNKKLALQILQTRWVKRVGVIHCHDWLVWDCARVLASEIGCPVVFSMHTNLQIRRSLGWDSTDSKILATALSFQAEALRQCEVVVVGSRRELVAARQISPIGRICIVRPSVSEYFESRSATDSPVADRTGCCVIGRAGPEKNHGLLYSSYAAICRSLGTPLRVAGEKSKICSLGETEYLGYLQDVGHLLKKAKWLLVPSFYDPGPLVASEAVANGAMPLLSSMTGVSEVFLESGLEEVVFSPFDMPDFLRVLQAAPLSSHKTNSAREALLDNGVSRDGYMKALAKLIDDLM